MSKSGSVPKGAWPVDTKPTVHEWAKEVGGKFAHVLEFKWANDSLFALVRTHESWEGISFKVPDNVTISMAHFRAINGGPGAIQREEALEERARMTPGLISKNDEEVPF
jgi:hypothetical protein